MKCAQGPKELRLSSWLLHVQLTGVDDICIKLQVTYNGERKIKSAKRRTYDFIYKTIEMTIQW